MFKNIGLLVLFVAALSSALPFGENGLRGAASGLKDRLVERSRILNGLNKIAEKLSPSALKCQIGMRAVTKGLTNTLVNQTQILGGLSQYVEDSFEADKEYEVSSFYSNIDKSIDQFEKTVNMALGTGAFKDELKTLDIDKMIKDFEALDSKQTMQNGVFKDAVRRLKQTQAQIEKGTSPSAASMSCPEKMSKLMDITAYGVSQGAEDLNSLLSDLYYKFYEAENPSKELEQELAIALKVAQSLQTASSRIGKLPFNEEQKQRLGMAKNFFESSTQYIEGMAQKENADSVNTLDSAVKSIIENVGNALN